MWFDTSPDYVHSVPPRKPASRHRTQWSCRRKSPGHKPSFDLLEDRTVPSVAPLPIPGGFPIPNPFGGPDVHGNLAGPVDSTLDGIGGEPSSITNFNGFVGVAHVEGTGTDGSGNNLLWDADLRFMKGVFEGADGKLQNGTFAFV